MQAMIFSAGLGTRFKPWTDLHPKALAKVNGKSLLQRNIEYLQQFGIKNIVVNVHHFADQVEKAIDENNGWGSSIQISDERAELLDTGGGLLHAERFFMPGERFITTNVDILTDLDIDKILKFHEEKKALISFGVTDRKTSRYLLFDNDNRMIGWKNIKTGDERFSSPLLESPDASGDAKRERGRLLAYSCIAVFEYEIFRLMKEKNFSGKFSLIDLYLGLARDYPIYGFDHTGDRLVDVGKPDSIAKAESLFPKNS